MVTDLITVDPRMDVFEAIGYLLKQRISGAPVVDKDRNFLGVFSEKTSMRVLVDAAYEQIPSAEVSAFANTDFGRVISEETDLLDCAQIFIDTPYRRLPVLRDGKLVGQISRRDVLTNAHVASPENQDLERMLLQCSDLLDLSDGPPEEVHGCLVSTDVRNFMHGNAKTIGEEVDLLSIAQTFLNTPYRRLPVLRNGNAGGAGQPPGPPASDASLTRSGAASRKGTALLELTAWTEVNRPSNSQRKNFAFDGGIVVSLYNSFPTSRGRSVSIRSAPSLQQIAIFLFNLRRAAIRTS